eukprot:1861242-Prymnesium_polylepis.2
MSPRIRRGQRSSLGGHRSSLGAGRSSLGAGRSSLGAGRSSLEAFQAKKQVCNNAQEVAAFRPGTPATEECGTAHVIDEGENDLIGTGQARIG